MLSIKPTYVKAYKIPQQIPLSLITWFFILFGLHSSWQCCCVCVMRCFRCSCLLPVKIFVISRLQCWTNVWTHSHLSLALPRDILCWNVYPAYLKQLASMSSSGRESCSLWFFTFHPLGSRCGPRSCVYAVRGDAWRQTSTPHPNNGLFLCSPLLSRLIIRIVSQGEWGCNMSYKLLWGLSLNFVLLTLPFTLAFTISLVPLCGECGIWWLCTWRGKGNENTTHFLRMPWMQIEPRQGEYHNDIIHVAHLICFKWNLD